MNYYVHNLDPILLNLGVVQIRWYGLMYLLGFVLSYFVLKNRHQKGLLAPDSEQIQNLITYVMIGMIIGSRLIYVTVYNPMYYMDNLSEVIAIWKGGLSFHGAALGFIAAVLLYGRKYGWGFFHLMDSVVIVSALGISLGRIGNFINGELYGRTTDVPWAVIFPDGGSLPRHPSQLYQSLGEGLCVLLILLWIEKREQKKDFAPQAVHGKGKHKIHWKRTGVLSCSFLILYGIARFIVEFYRQPDIQLGFYFKYFSMGQILCTLMIIAGVILLTKVIRKPISEDYEVRL